MILAKAGFLGNFSKVSQEARNAPRKPLTHTRQAEAAKPESRPCRLNAGDGLFLEVIPSGAKRWRLRYFHLGKETMLSLGKYPAVGLAEAKEARDVSRKLLAMGTNPARSAVMTRPPP